MANPSLQIGNRKWAIKEDNLLGYSKAGTRFVPQPITMTRASAGTRVNSSGLVETVELLGSEEVTCGDFSCAAPLDSWVVADGSVTFSSGAIFDVNTKIYQNNIIVSGTVYKFTYEITDNTGGMTFRFYNGDAYTFVDDSVGVHTVYFTGAGTNPRFYVSTLSGTSLTLKNVSVKESTKNNLARVDYDGTASSLLAEPERTNNLTASQDLTVSFWNTIRVETIVASTVLSPDGSSFGFKAIPNEENHTHYIDYDYGYLSMTSGVELTYSVFVKPFGYTNFQIATSTNMNSRYQNFELTGDGALGAGDVNGAKIEKIGDWYRCSVTAPSTGTSPRVISVATPTSGLGRNPTFTGNGTDGVLLWGGQIEEGTYATSYIPNLSTINGSTVTRVQDQYSKTGISNLINSEEGVLFVEMAALSDDLTIREISLSDGTNTNRVELRYANSVNKIQAVIRSNGGAIVLQTSTPPTITNFNKIAFKYKSGDFALWINGVEVATNTTSFLTSGLNRLGLDNGSGGENFYGKVKQLQVFKTALTDTELATLTT